MAATANISIPFHTEVVDGAGAGRLEELSLGDRGTGEVERRPASSLFFIMIGAEPRTDWLDGAIDRDPRGFVLTGGAVPGRVRVPGGPERDRYLLETSVPGVFAVGDVRASSVKRVASAVGEGAIAVQFVHQYLSL